MGGCAAVMRDEYFAVRGGSDRKELSDQRIQYIYSALKPDVAILERGDVHFRMTVEDRGEFPILFGVLVPVIPLFLQPAWKTPLQTDHLSLRLDVGGLIPAERPVRLRFDEIRLRSASHKEQQAPIHIKGAGRHGLSDCEARRADLPSNLYVARHLGPPPSLFSFNRKREYFYTFRLEYQPGFSKLDSLEFDLGGVTIGNDELEPIRVVFSRRRDWYWMMFGLSGG